MRVPTQFSFLLRRAVFACGLLVSTVVQAQLSALPPQVQSAWRASGLPDTALSLVVQDTEGNVLVSHNADVARNPASVMKMVSTWVGLSSLGPDYTWRTTFLADHGASVDAQGSLRGPLYIKASGDPFLTIPDLWNMLRELRMRGVKNLNSVVLDKSVFGAVTINPAAFDGAGDRPYNASPDALVVGLGASRIVLQPDPEHKRWIPLLDPAIPGLRISGDVAWQEGVCPGSPAIGTTVRGTPQGATIELSGRAIGSCGEFSVYRLALNQNDFFEAVFRALWKDLGGTLARGFSVGPTPSRASAIIWHDSLPLADQIRAINKRSNNLMATMLHLTVGAELNGQSATINTADNAAMRVLAQQGVNTQGWRIDNGSGLSRTARVTASGLAQMLQVAWRSNYMPEYISSLAIAGVDGTMRRRLQEGTVQGKAHLKTGTLRDARALSGYVLGADGKRYILVSIVNDSRSASVRPFDDALVRWLATR